MHSPLAQLIYEPFTMSVGLNRKDRTVALFEIVTSQTLFLYKIAMVVASV